MKTFRLGCTNFLVAGFLMLPAALLLSPSMLLAQSEDFSSSVTSRVSEKTIGGFAQSNGASMNARVSKNGRFVVFESLATNLVPDPFNNIDWNSSDSSRRRIYLFDRQANSIELVSLSSPYSDNPFHEIEADAYNPVVSNDGRYVAFTVAYNPSVPVADIVNVCYGTNCHIHTAHEGQHIYVRDRIANDTMLISQITEKVRRCLTIDGVGQTEARPGGGIRPIMESITRRVSARVIGDCTDRPPYNTTSECTARSETFNEVYSVAHSDNARLSSDGRYVVFDTDANNLSFLVENEASKPFPIADDGCGAGCEAWEYDGATGLCGSSTDGHFAGNNFLHEWASFYDDYEYYNTSGTTNLKIRDVYLRDGADYKTTMVSQFCKFHEPGVQCDVDAVEDAIKPSISDDGSLISFESKTPFLDLDFNISYSGSPFNTPVNGDDVFVIQRSLINGEAENLFRVSNDTSRLLASNGNSTNALLSADGRYVVFQSTGSNLVSSDTNALSDIFLFDRNFNRTLLCSKLSTGVQLNAAASDPTVSGSGEYVSFESAATNTAYTGAFGTISQVYAARVSKNSDGSIKDCSLQLASPATGQGSNASALGSGIAVVPQTVVVGGVTSRIQRSSIVYESAATNLDATITDNNGVADIFQAPICTERDRTTDTDGDATTDCFDQCYTDPIKVEDADTDSDGYANCEDGCPSDPQKSGPQTCGCGAPDIDSDGDGVFDCKDSCPNDPNKTGVGQCGCGIPDTDANGNGTADCNDSTVPTPVASPTPVRTATPVPSPTPDLASVFRALTPGRPSLSKGPRRGTLKLVQGTGNVPSGVEVSGFKADFTCTEKGKKKTYRKNNTLGGVLTGFKSGGRCSVKVTLRGSFAGLDLLSKTSASSSTATVP